MSLKKEQQMETPNYILVGRLGKIYGLQGYLYLHSFTLPESRILTYPLYYEKKGSYFELLLEANKIHNKQLLIKIKDTDSPETIKNQFTGTSVYTLNSALPPLPVGQYYFYQLEGLSVYNKANDYYGTVYAVISSTPEPLLHIKDGKKEQLIPLIYEQYVLNVDLDKKCMTVDWEWI